MSSTDFECCALTSRPSSPSAVTANGFTREGCEPADWTRTASPKSARARPSAIWERAELATQRKSTLSKRRPGMGAPQ